MSHASILCHLSKENKKEVLIFDTDMGTDDAAALLLLTKRFHHIPTYIIATHGNTTPDRAARNAVILRKYLDCQESIIVCGALPEKVFSEESGDFHGSDGLANISYRIASSLCIEESDFESVLSLEELKERLSFARSITYIATGPLTSLAELIKDDYIRSKFRKIYVMGGGVNESNCKFGTEFNFARDPVSVKKVLESGLDITLFPLDLTNHHGLSDEEINVLQHTGAYTEYIEFLCFNKASNSQYDGIDKAVLHDCMPVIYFGNKKGFSVRDILLASDENGRITKSEYGKSIHVALKANDGILFRSIRETFENKQ